MARSIRHRRWRRDETGLPRGTIDEIAEESALKKQEENGRLSIFADRSVMRVDADDNGQFWEVESNGKKNRPDPSD